MAFLSVSTFLPVHTVYCVQTLKAIDLDTNGKVAFIEYALFKYKKTLEQLFADKPENFAALIAKLEEAIALNEEVKKRRAADAAKEEELTKTAEGSGVSAAKAKMELEGLRVRSQTGENMAEVRAGFKKRQAEKALAAGDPMAQEMERLKLEQKEAEDVLTAKRAESKAKLAARAAAFGSADQSPIKPK
jgi:hypothetical protein